MISLWRKRRMNFAKPDSNTFTRVDNDPLSKGLHGCLSYCAFLRVNDLGKLPIQVRDWPITLYFLLRSEFSAPSTGQID